jgi:hypothetical protein
VHVVVVVRERLDDSARPLQPERLADERHLRPGGDEPVDELLGEPAIDL